MPITGSPPLRPGAPPAPAPTCSRYRATRAFARSSFPQPGHVLIVADYASMELRAAAYISGDPVMTRAFEEGQDLHKHHCGAHAEHHAGPGVEGGEAGRESGELRRDLRHRRPALAAVGVEQLPAGSGRRRGQALARRLRAGFPDSSRAGGRRTMRGAPRRAAS